MSGHAIPSSWSARVDLLSDDRDATELKNITVDVPFHLHGLWPATNRLLEGKIRLSKRWDILIPGNDRSMKTNSGDPR